MTLLRGSLDHMIVQLNHKIIAHQMIQDPLTVSHQQREKRMFDGTLIPIEKTAFSDAVLFLSWFEHDFSPRPLDAGVSKRVSLYSRCTCSHASFSTCLKASSLSDLTCKQGYLARMTARK